MLFYVKGGPKEEVGPPPKPSKELLELLIKEWETVINLKQQGKIVGSYAFIDRPGGFFVFNVESRGELDMLLSKLPLHPFAKFDIVTLITAEKALERVKQDRVSGESPE